MFLDGVIGRRGIGNTASSLYPCQKHSLNVYILRHKSIINLTQKANILCSLFTKLNPWGKTIGN
jgi:hypothetical protein